ncbi:MAG: DoxX family protein [Acidimicrobiia bacterium]
MRHLTERLDAAQPVGLLLTRLVIGGLFVHHGIDKYLTGGSTIETMFASWGVPAVIVTATFTMMLEVFGGLALIAGRFTRSAAGSLALLLLFAIYYVKLDLGIISSGPMPGAELDLAYIAALLTLITQGPGRWSWDHARRRAHDDATAGEQAGAALPA